MNKLGYKQKGMSMLKSSPVKNDDEDSLAREEYERRQTALAPKTEPYVKKGGKATGSMKNYAIGSQGRFNEYAARGWKQDATTAVKGGNTAKVETKNRYSNESLSEVNDLLKVNPVDKDGSGKRTDSKPAAKIKSNKDIRKEKRANIKGGMSRQEARLKKTQSKAASAKAKTNRTIKSIDPTKAKSADTGAKQTSAKSTRAKAKRLEKRAERLKGRVNASKVSK